MKKLRSILLVDDNDATNFLNSHIIRRVDAADEILIALNGKEALNCIKEYHDNHGRVPDLVLLDINMPVMSGFEFLEEYHQFEEQLKASTVIVMLTSSLNPKDVKRISDLGNYDFLSKPLTKDKLRDLIAEHFAEA